MSELRFEAVTHGELKRVSAAFGAGSRVVLGNESDGTNTLVQLAAGLARPTLGRALLDGVAPWSSARTRRGVVALCAEEALLPGRNVESAVTLALRARSDPRSARGVLDAAGAASFAERRSGTLTARERRAVALAISLTHPGPALLALHEPLGLLNQDFTLQALTRFAQAGAIVLCTANRLEDAARLGNVAGALERGYFLDSTQAQPPLGRVALRVHTPEPRRLAARLSEAPNIQGVEWSGGLELLAIGADLESVAQAVVANARAEAIRITALKQDAPALEALAAARAGLAQAYYERARAVPGQP